MALGRMAAFGVATATVALLALASTASALPVYRIYFLKDSPDAPDTQFVGSMADGVLSLYTTQHPNRPSNLAPQIRLVYPVASDVEPVKFLTAANETHPDRLKGLIYIVLFPGVASVPFGNITATLYEIPSDATSSIPDLPLPLPLPLPISDPQLPEPLGTMPRVIASTSMKLDLNASRAPNPVLLAAPFLPLATDPAGYAQMIENDPQAYLNFTVGWEALVTANPPLVYVGSIDTPVNATSRIALTVTMTQGDSPAPLPVGAFGTLNYDGAFQPSFVMLPWYTKDPVKPITSPTKKPTGTSSNGNVVYTGSRSSSAPSGSEGAKGSPDLGLLALPALAVMVALARRRLPR